MTIFVDPPLWPAHGRLWSHLISDDSVAELHAFAERVGIPVRSFEGDHYDVPEERYAAVLAAGAVPVAATELARRLRDSGLRFRKRKGERPLARVDNGLASATAAPHVLDVIASPLERGDAGASVVLLRAPAPRREGGSRASSPPGKVTGTTRPGPGGPEMVMAMVRNASRPGWAPPGGKRDPGESLRESAVREVAEETGLVLEPGALTPVGYERITVASEPDVDPRPFGVGINHLQVFAAVVIDAIPLRPDLDDVLEAAWFTRAHAARLSDDRPWWPLVDWWWERH